MNLESLHVYAVTPAVHQWKELVEKCRTILESGVKVIQLRDKERPDNELIVQARELKTLTEQHGAYLIINDRVAVAKASNADGVHLGQTDMPISEARKLLGPDAIIGISVRTPDEVLSAQAEGANYLGANGIFESRTKTDLPGPPLGLEGIRHLRTASPLPLIAIGGITADNARDIIISGADGVAVISALFSAKKISEAAHTLEHAVAEGLRLRQEQESLRDGKKR